MARARFPILVNLRDGRTAEIVSVARSPTNTKFVYVHFGPELTTKNTDPSRRGDPQAFYNKEDLFRLVEAASKAAHKFAWPRETRVFLLAIPIAIVLFILGWLFYWACIPAGLMVLITPLFLKKKRTKIVRETLQVVNDDILAGTAHKLLTPGSALDRVSAVQDGVWITPTTIVFIRPGFWE